MFLKNIKTSSLIISKIKSIDYHFYWVGVIAILSGLFIEYQIWSLIFKSQNLTTVNGFIFRDLMIFIFLSIISLLL